MNRTFDQVEVIVEKFNYVLAELRLCFDACALLESEDELIVLNRGVFYAFSSDIVFLLFLRNCVDC